ncbi:type IV secretory system conjugative DNA transfer family protein [Buttiauxella sp. B2]|uniref:type IV secretory system conjugative DNA transfer family protein n=1 Tax=Buttiauxella sp. B2 TaxID=2587812 RepID=UPI0011231CD1|nr:type IV secretory system conjugative DNA transfer family protein [Buttiauxella sp. B2]TNV16101.1 type IV secretory system conjugative DNA transfer family protein [Buttiauxella sp. B2]
MKKVVGILFVILILFGMAIIGGDLLGGFAALKYSGMNTSLLNLHTFYDVVNTYNGNPAYKNLVAVTWLAFSLPLIVFLGFCILVLVNLRPVRVIYGDARLANQEDFRKSGFFPTPSQYKKFKYPPILIGKMFEGKYKGQYIYYYGQQFLMLYAPTRSGKGVGIVIPNCLNYPESLVVLDIKLENWFLTSGYRQKVLEQKCFLFCPAGYVENEEKAKAGEYRSHRWNPMDHVSRDVLQRESDLRKIAAIIYPLSGGDGDVWNTSAMNLFIGLGLYLLDKEQERAVSNLEQGAEEDNEWNEPQKPIKVSISAILLSATPGGDLAAWMRKTLAKDAAVSNDTRNYFERFMAAPDKTRGSIMSNFTNGLDIFANPVTAAATSASDFDIRRLRKEKMSVYLGLTPDALVTHTKLVNLFFSMVVNENTKELPEQNPELKYQCLIALDEFTSMGRVEIIQKSIAYTAGFNLRYVFILQNKGQMEDDKLYRKEGTETFIKNCAVELVYPPRDVDDAVKEVSERIGVCDEKIKRKSKSDNRGAAGGSNSTNHDVIARAVLLPDEIVSLGKIKNKSGSLSVREIILSEACRPFIADKIVYFEDPIFMGRVQVSKDNLIEIPLLFNK